MKQNELFTTFPKLLDQVDLGEIGLLIKDSPDWETAANAIADVIIGSTLLMAVGKVSEATDSLVLIAQIVYLMGYKRGKAENAMPIFMVGEETE